ncbi:MAG: CaiB/BaiF CoA transferase family protein [Dehalococcoidia bacterium]
MTGPLSGLKVLDISEGIAGPFCARLLGDLGADVIKVEPPGGDLSRRLGPFPGGVEDPERSAAFLAFNASKRGIMLDLETDSGRDQVARLIATHDVIIAGETNGEFAARGLGFDQLAAWNPRVILTTISGFGSQGPRAGWKWSHLTTCATGGWARTCGLPDREPLQAGGAITDTLTGAFAAVATLLAVLGRRQHGHGDHVDVSAQQAALCAALFPSLRYEYTGALAERNSALGPGPSFMLPALDGFIGVNVLTPLQWSTMCDFLGRPDIAANPRYAGTERVRLSGEVAAAFGEAVRERTVSELFHEGEAWRLPFGLVPSLAELVDLPPHRERAFFVSLDHPVAGRVEVPGIPFKSTVTSPFPFRPPLLGEHNADVLADLPPMPVSAAATAVPSRPPQLAPLAGLKILDLTMFFSGPLATQIAGDAGADVIKVESVQRIDGWRGATSGAVETPWERAPNFNWVNRSKRGITLNLADERGKALVKQLIADADVVIENYTPRVMGNFGLDYETIRAINPRIIMMSMPGFGADVSWRDYVAFGMSTEQMSGISHLTGYADGPPLFTSTNGGDPFVGVIAATALLAALYHRETMGEGQHIDLSQVEACTLFVSDAVAGWTLARADPGRIGNFHRTHAPHGIYPCLDNDWIAIDCQDDTQWKSLSAAIGRPHWSEPSSPMATAAGRLECRLEIDEAIAQWTRTASHLALMDYLQSLAVAAGAVLSGPDILEDPQLAAREAFIEQDRPGIGVKHYPAQPYTFRFANPSPNRRAPLLGEHSREVLSSRLGLSPAELDDLEAADVIGTRPIAAR